METLMTYISFCLAIVVVISYFIKPNFEVVIYFENALLKAKVKNKNIFFKIVDVYCELVISNVDTFSSVTTLQLEKDHTLCLTNDKNDEYVFWVKRDNNYKIQSRKYLRARIIAPNILGIKKVKTITKEIKDIP